MAKKQTQPSTTVENAAEVENTMSDTNTTTQTTVNTALNVLLETTANGNSHRLVAYHSDRPYDPMRDLSLSNNLLACKAGLEMVAKYVAGGVFGNANLILVAPVEKLFATFGTGTMAYVSSAYDPARDAVTVELEGVKYTLTVDQRDIPNEGWNRLDLLQGKLYKRSYEDSFTVRSENPWIFWYCLTGSAMLSEDVNVSISIGPKLIERAQQVMAVVNADNPEEMNEQRRFVNRQAARVNREMRDNLETAEVQVNAGVPDADYMVPLYTGGEITLKDWPYRTPIMRRSDGGMLMEPIRLPQWGSDSLATRLAAATAITSQPGITVEL